ncbi:hypothetical protein [Segatella copri]|jgi:hypothetical protein|uniref:hypothetical protein n=1 Tax=Prevotellaceae TaxID=171552 RepID=UPI0026014563|nr:hypothetical protein [Segatella copri]MDY5671498.1 hypothetical protein [Prevotella sp.]MDY6204870.1 hypothetical protein [Segatella copri]
MNKTFDLHRFGMVLRWDLLTNWKSYFYSIAGLAIGIIMLSISMLYSFPHSHFIVEGDLGNYYEGNMTGFLAAIVILFFFISPCNIFSNMKTKLQRENFMMLPANNLEKYAARFLMMSVGSILMMLIATLIADFVQFVLSFFMTPGYHASIIGSSLSQIYKAATNTGDNPICILAGQYKIDAAILGWSFLTMIYSFCLLGGTFFRKQPIILTAVSGIIIFMIIGYCGSELEEWGAFDFFKHFNYDNPGTSLCIAIFWSVVFLALAAFSLWASYKLFTRMQVICNKWINI